MKQILIIGAGKSSTVLVDYLLETATERQWRVIVADRDLALATAKIGGHPQGAALGLDVDDGARRAQAVREADLVVSLMPPALHAGIAEDCVECGTDFICASYVSSEMRALAGAAERAGVMLLNEIGVDPGIDHMSAMEKLDELRAANARIRAFETFTGGLVAPESDDNPWGYKFTWNPRAVVLAGQGIVKFKHNQRFKYIPYHRLFRRYEPLRIPGYGDFEGYPNRDSLRYRRDYGLYDIDTIYRGTLRRAGFCKAWDCLVQLGLTDDSYQVEDLDGMTYREFVNSYLWYDPQMSVELKVRAYLRLDLNSAEFDKLEWLGLFERKPIGLRRATPAQVLQKLLEERWTLGPQDKDMIAMLHKLDYEIDGERWALQSSMVTLGETPTRTAMAKTVGLPLGIAARLSLDGELTRKGVVIPTVPDVYVPVLRELRNHGIAFEEEAALVPAAVRS